ncbi:hypothetical protein Krac_2573 [Ktedonobacter racemifer DSM 44963]|uniref:Uncharacterized protein n=1 Tax=Ktedonobacter racemifer DSM 44963 TaxID=485913 RepID=D6TZ31_KTERA|nr:hypothetical protein Krac_2573 [Ktedonobacter racemifer DSM 44963]
MIQKRDGQDMVPFDMVVLITFYFLAWMSTHPLLCLIQRSMVCARLLVIV